MHTRLLLPATAFAALATLPSCAVPELEAQAAYAQLSLDGQFGYSDPSTTSIRQDIPSAFGLGDAQGSPYGRVQLDTGVQVISVSGFDFQDSGDGVLQADFGNNLTASTAVHSDFKLRNAKGAYAFEIPIGPVSISPGIALDYIDLDIQLRDLIGIATERVQLNAPVPLAFVRGEVDLGIVSAVAEVGYLSVNNIDDVDGSLLDIEALLVVHPTGLLELLAGYRMIDLKVDGLVDNQTFDTDIQLGGFFVGGGLRF